MPTTVLVDGTSVPPKPGGVARYIEQLAAELVAIPDLTLRVVCQERHAQRFASLVGAEAVITISPIFASVPARLLWEQLRLPSLARRARADVIHCPHYTMPLFTRIARVVTLHDATFFSLPETHSFLKRMFFRTWIRISTKRAARCITPSAATRDEVIRYVHADPDRIVVAYSGVDMQVFHQPTADAISAAKAATALPSNEWVAFLATIEPRKNLGGLIAGFAELWSDDAFRERHPDLVLAIAGADGWGPTAQELIAAQPASVPIERLGYLPTDDLAGFLGGARAFVYPSLGEGFGLPVLEAMACGTPVVTTAELALREVGGDAVEYTGTSASSIAASLKHLLDSPARAAELAAAGLIRAATFTWLASALIHASVYRAAANASAASGTAHARAEKAA